MMGQNRTMAYVAPFATFMALLAAGQQGWLKGLGEWEYAVRVGVVGLVIAVVSRPVLDFRVRNFLGSLLVGVGVFVLWIAPDTLIPGWRQNPVFTVFGEVKISLSAEQLASPLLLVFRTLSAAVMVPILEELFWRGWMMRWWVNTDFESLPMGQTDRQGFWIVAALFALEHGPFWEVGLITGVIYNWWMTKTRSLGDLIFVHGVTNLVLSLYVIATKQWQFWM
jgi:CAAX prenyl protease-like protein